MNNVKITDIKVTLCDTRVKGNFADSTRQVETIASPLWRSRPMLELPHRRHLP